MTEESEAGQRDGPDAFVMALDGSGSSPVDWREVPHFRYSSRSPDGTKEAVVVLREEGDEENLARLQITNVGEHESSVIPLPELHQSGLCVFDPTGPLPVRSDFPKGTVCVSDATWVTNPTWSPNSMRVVFTSLTKLIWAVDIDGSNLVELTNGLGGREPAWQPTVRLLLRRASSPSRGARSNRCFLINRASCIGAVRSASRPYAFFYINPPYRSM